MRFCPNCGKELPEGVHFCGNCGCSLQSNDTSRQQSRPVNSKQLHCPECNSTSISPVVETDITGGTSLNHSFSKRNSVSTMQFSNTHRNYWMCSNCGCKFRNIQNLEEEIRKNQSLIKRGIVGTILCAVFALLWFAMIGFDFITALWIFIILLCITAFFIIKRRTAKLIEERAYLKKHCFG